jgi:hypothetical protein
MFFILIDLEHVISINLRIGTIGEPFATHEMLERVYQILG